MQSLSTRGNDQADGEISRQAQGSGAIADAQGWGAALERALNCVASGNVGVLDEVEQMRGEVRAGLQEIVREVREQDVARRREERARVAYELVAIWELACSILADVDHVGRSALLGRALEPLREGVEALAESAEAALHACGVEVREDGSFDPLLDVVVAVEPVRGDVPEKQVLRVEAAGFVWMDGSGVLRQRHVVVAKSTRST